MRDFTPLFPLPADPRKQGTGKGSGKGRSIKYQIWDGSDWDAGFVCAKKDGRFPRMWVYRPDYGLYGKRGYILRAHAVWWLATGSFPRYGYDIHHKDENTLNDLFANLAEKEHGEHTRHHHLVDEEREFECPTCREIFTRKLGRLLTRTKEGRSLVQYCSRQCYHATNKQWLKGKHNPHTAKLNATSVIAIRERYPQETYHKLATAYNVSVMTISKIIHRKTWGHL